MIFAFERYCKDGKLRSYEGSLILSSGNSFTFYFNGVTDNIGLNDGNFHCIDRLSGAFTKILMDRYSIHLEGCFVNIGGKWHKDEFTFSAVRPEVND